MFVDFKKKIINQYPQIEILDNSDCISFSVPNSQLTSAGRYLRDICNFDILTDIAAIDRGKVKKKYAAIYHFYSIRYNSYIRFVVNCSETQKPTLPSLVSLWPAANWHEREAFDMMGIVFIGHPDLRRILMWDNYPYHPLRKNFPPEGIESTLPHEDASDYPYIKPRVAQMTGGPFNSQQEVTLSKREPRPFSLSHM